MRTLIGRGSGTSVHSGVALGDVGLLRGVIIRVGGRHGHLRVSDVRWDRWLARNDSGAAGLRGGKLKSSSPAAPTPPRDWSWATNVNALSSQPGRHPNPSIANLNPEMPTSLSSAVPSPLHPSASYPVSGKRRMVPTAGERSTTVNPKSTTPTATEHGRTPPKAQTPGAHPSSREMKPQVGISVDVKHARRF